MTSAISKFSLMDRVAIVTGSGAGIGKGIALVFAQSGAQIVLAEMNPATAEETATDIRNLGGQAWPVATDVTNSEQIARMVNATVDRFGRIDILVNNAGGSLGESPAAWLSEQQWDKILRLNLTSVFLCCKAVAMVMLKQRAGSIINIASGTGQRSSPGLCAYAAAKAGVINFTETLARELAEYHVRVNAISPSRIETKRNVDTVGPRRERGDFVGLPPLGRIGHPDDIAGAALYLASDVSDFVTGIVIEVKGGPVTRKGDWESFKAKYPNLLERPTK